MTRRVAVIGAGGQLGHDLMREWPAVAHGDELLPLNHADVEVTDLGGLRRVLEGVRPDVVVNTSAYHKVDVVEDDPDQAFRVNGSGPRNIAVVAAELGFDVIHLSTDYVFSGAAGRAYVEEDPVDPVNVYGVSKAAGEMLLRYVWPRHYIVRSSGLYGLAGSSGKGGNFVETMLRLGREGRPVRVVADQVLTPTGTRPLARQLAILSTSREYGTYHATCQGQCSWFEFAAEIFRLAGLEVDLSPQSTAESGARARRPPHSVLANRRLQQLALDQMPAWQESLASYLEARKAAASA